MEQFIEIVYGNYDTKSEGSYICRDIDDARADALELINQGIYDYVIIRVVTISDGEENIEVIYDYES